MLKSGLVSITFRDLSVEEIIELTVKANLDAIEWGGDIHVPHGNIDKAKKVKQMTRKANLSIAAYGSYYKAGCKNEEISSFEEILQTAKALGAPIIRVWAGNKGTKNATDQDWKDVINDTKRITKMAANEGIKIAYEYHQNTLTDTPESTKKLISKVNHSNLYTYWQPPHHLNSKECEKDLIEILPWLTNVHVFYWTHDPERVKHPLVDARKDWTNYLSLLKKKKINNSVKDHYAMLEFIKNDSIDQFYKDANILNNIIDKLEK